MSVESETVELSKCQRIKSFMGSCSIFLLFGIMNAVVLKWATVIEAEGLPEYGVHAFQKPWFLTAICFISMGVVACPWYQCLLWFSKNKETDPRLKPWSVLSFKEFCEFAIPAFSDVFEGIISAVCIVFVGVSYDSMMKSGTLIGVSLIAKFIFKQQKPCYQWVAIVFVVIALTMVGAAGIINSGNGSETASTPKIWVAVIIILKFISQVGYAVKISYEEYFTQQKGHHPIMVVGLTGFWSMLMCIVLLVIAQYLPGEEGNGIHEDSLDTFEQIKNSLMVQIVVIISFLLGFSYNIASVSLIGSTSAIVRTLMEAFRTFLIWMVQFMIYYGFSSNSDPAVNHYRLVGEEWGIGSYVQLAGFVLMTMALLAYNGFPKYPCFDYNMDLEDENEDKEDKEYGTDSEEKKIEEDIVSSENVEEVEYEEGSVERDSTREITVV